MLKAEEGAQVAAQIATECARILTPGGVCAQVTDEDPDTRLTLLQAALSLAEVDLSFKTVESDSYEYFVYLIRKKLRLRPTKS